MSLEARAFLPAKVGESSFPGDASWAVCRRWTTFPRNGTQSDTDAVMGDCDRSSPEGAACTASCVGYVFAMDCAAPSSVCCVTRSALPCPPKRVLHAQCTAHSQPHDNPEGDRDEVLCILRWAYLGTTEFGPERRQLSLVEDVVLAKLALAVRSGVSGR